MCLLTTLVLHVQAAHIIGKPRQEDTHTQPNHPFLLKLRSNPATLEQSFPAEALEEPRNP
jgi:hypothetical protein